MNMARNLPWKLEHKKRWRFYPVLDIPPHLAFVTSSFLEGIWSPIPGSNSYSARNQEGRLACLNKIGTFTISLTNAVH